MRRLNFRDDIEGTLLEHGIHIILDAINELVDEVESLQEELEEAKRNIEYLEGEVYR